MISEFIQAIFNQFSLKILYVTTVWFALFGYGAHLISVMLLTHMPSSKIWQSVARLHAIALIASFLLTPVCVAMSSGLIQILYPDLIIAQGYFLWFSLNMMLFSTCFFCSVFVSTSCKRYQSLLVVVEGIVGFLGYFVLKGLNIL